VLGTQLASRYGTHHHVTPVQDGAGGWHDHLGTRRTR